MIPWGVAGSERAVPSDNRKSTFPGVTRNSKTIVSGGLMYWLMIPLFFLFTSCASMNPGRSYFDVTYMPPTQGPQMDIEAMRDHHIDRLR